MFRSFFRMFIFILVGRWSRMQWQYVKGETLSMADNDNIRFEAPYISVDVISCPIVRIYLHHQMNPLEMNS